MQCLRSASCWRLRTTALALNCAAAHRQFRDFRSACEVDFLREKGGLLSQHHQRLARHNYDIVCRFIVSDEDAVRRRAEHSSRSGFEGDHCFFDVAPVLAAFAEFGRLFRLRR